MSVRFGSVIWLAAFAVLASGCFPAVPPPLPGEPGTPGQLSGTAWVLESATNAPTPAQPAQPAPAAATTGTTTQPAVTPAPAPAPMQAAWILPGRGSRPTLSFSADRDAASGSTGCNRYFGNFAYGPDALWFGALATTKMMCFDTLAIQEIEYLDALSKVKSYANDGKVLTLFTSDGRQLTYSPLSNPVGTRAAVYKYVCDDGLYFTANYDPATKSAALQLSDGTTDTLTQEASAAAVSYSSQRYHLDAKGNEALLDTRSDGVTHHCVAPLAPQG